MFSIQFSCYITFVHVIFLRHSDNYRSDGRHCFGNLNTNLIFKKQDKMLGKNPYSIMILNCQTFSNSIEQLLQLLVMFCTIVLLQADPTIPFWEKAEVTIRTNYTGTLNVCNTLFALLRSHARWVLKFYMSVDQVPSSLIIRVVRRQRHSSGSNHHWLAAKIKVFPKVLQGQGQGQEVNNYSTKWKALLCKNYTCAIWKPYHWW